MVPCPACHQVAFDAGRCGSCGFQVVSGQPSSPPPVLDVSALVEIDTDGGPSLPGFESTSLVTDPGPSAPDPALIQNLQCPRCRTAQPTPTPTLCDHCGYRLKPRSRVEAPKDDDERIRCGECGISNAADRSTCINCGSRITTE